MHVYRGVGEGDTSFTGSLQEKKITVKVYIMITVKKVDSLVLISRTSPHLLKRTGGSSAGNDSR